MKGKAFGGGVRTASLAVIIALFAISAVVLAGDFSSSSEVSTYEAQTASHSFNISVANTDSSSNITLVNITLPSGFTYITNSNYTAYSSIAFINDSTTMTWFNLSEGGIVNTTQTIYFNFSATVNTTPEDYNFTVTTEDETGTTSSTNVTITVEDTTDPSQITLISPGNDTWINASSVMLNLSYIEINPASCVYDSATANVTNSSSSSPCQILVTGYSNGTWNYSLYVNDNSGNYGINGTYTLKYDATAPASEALELMYQGSDVSGGTITTRDNVTVRVNITEDGSGVSQAIARIYNASGGNFLNLTLQNQSGYWQADWDTVNDYSGDGTYSINITLNDNAGNYVFEENSTTVHFEGAPDLQVVDVDWYSDNPVSGHPNSGNNLTLNISVTNAGDENFTGSVNVTVKIGTSYYPTTVKDRTSIANTSLNESDTAYYNVTFSSGNFTSDGLHYFYIQADPEGAVNETLDTNNDYSLNLTLGYNITLISVNNGTDTIYPPTIAKGFHYTNMTFNISVSFANGDNVSGLNFTQNFTFSSTHASENDDDLDSRNALIKQSEGSGYYIFNLTLTGPFYGSDKNIVPYVGNGQLTATVANGSYSGSSALGYNMTAPKLSVDIDIDTTTYSGSDFNHGFNMTIDNDDGNSPAVDVFFDKDPTDDDGNWRYMSFIDYVDHDTITPFTLNPDESHEFSEEEDDLHVRIVGTKTDNSRSLEVWINYTDAVGNDFIAYDQSKFDSNPSDTGEDEEEGGGSTGTDSNVEFGLTLTDWDDEIQGYPGESNTTRVEVKNSGDLAAVVKVSFTCDPVGNAAIAPTSKSVAINQRQEFVIGLDIDPEAEIGEYDCKVRAYVSTSESDYDEEIIVLKVLATPEGAARIDDEYQNLSAKVRGLLERFALVNPSMVNDTNLTRVENMIDNANETIQAIWDSIQDGDYLSAKELIDTLQASLLVTESSLSDLELEQARGGGTLMSGTWFWAVIIIVVVIAVAFVAYMFFPQKGYGPKKSILGTLSDTLKGGGSKIGSVKDSGKSLLGKKDGLKPKSYASGTFRKQPVTGYSSGQGPGAKIKGAINKLKEKLKRKKPQKEVTQYFASSSSNIINYS